MVGYFKPLRRRIGVVMLVMACVFAAGWVRSITTADTVSWSAPAKVLGREVRFDSSGQGLMVLIDSHASTVPKRTFGFWSKTYDINRDWFNNPDNFSSWQLRSFGFGYARTEYGFVIEGHESGTAFVETWRIPYWSIVIPLTLMSAWLLLSKPRRSNQDEILGTVLEKVA